MNMLISMLICMVVHTYEFLFMFSWMKFDLEYILLIMQRIIQL